MDNKRRAQTSKPRKDAHGFVSPFREKLMKKAAAGDPVAGDQMADFRAQVSINKMRKKFNDPKTQAFYKIEP
jgi:hypothetical protein